MGKGVSVSRRILRLQLGVNRKLTVIRWNEYATVGVVNTTSTYLKADEGAERSCLRRRKRGQRKGKDRSRGRHPRRTPSPPARSSKQPTSRTINRMLRAYDHWAMRAKQLEKLFRHTSHEGLFLRSSSSYSVWRTRWRTLFLRIEQQQNRVFATAKLQTSFLEWLVWVARVKIPLRDVRSRQTGLVHFAELVEGIRSLSLDFPPVVRRHTRVEKQESLRRIPDHEPYQYLSGRSLICSFCGRQATVWRLHGCAMRWERSQRRRGR